MSHNSENRTFSWTKSVKIAFHFSSGSQTSQKTSTKRNFVLVRWLAVENLTLITQKYCQWLTNCIYFVFISQLFKVLFVKEKKTELSLQCELTSIDLKIEHFLTFQCQSSSFELYTLPVFVGPNQLLLK